ncbi:MAG TPA: PilZ domain-containing protein [Tianweitania sediminis]|jgi:alginate biosynthesis protein Alg44|nr:PilZ domain-containing protein [Tianweitania sediminis]
MASIKHEAETQRQHPRYRLPMRAGVKGRFYDVVDWSLGGFALQSGSDFTKGEVVRAGLIVPMNGYDLSIKVSAEVRYVADDAKRVGFAFVDLEDPQASLLRYVADALVAGELVAAGDIVDVAGRQGTGRSRGLPGQVSESGWQSLARGGRRLASGAAVLTIIGALGAYLWANVYEEVYVVRAQAASVSAKVVNVASPAVGRVGFLNENAQVALGEPLMTVTPTAGDPITVQSPCDCRQVRQEFSGGDFVKTGDTVVKLMRVDAPMVVSALVPPDRLMSLYGLQKASIVYADGRRVDDAGILWLPGQDNARGDLPRSDLTVVLDPRRELSAHMMGQPVEVTFDLFSDSLVGRLVHSVAGPLSAMAAGKSAEETASAR